MTKVDLTRRNKLIKKQTFKAQEAKTIKVLIITLGLMIVFFASMFMLLTSQSAQQGYALEQEKQRQEELLLINQKLHTKVTNSTAIATLENDERLKNMDTTDEKTYITPEDNS